jgi:hypothetical protein
VIVTVAGGEVSTAWPPTNVVAAIVYAPGQVLLGTVKGNENVFFVFAGRKNGGVVNITVPVTVIVPPTATVEGESLIVA